ncbi:MAG: ATP-binding protein [Lachnospiraceae bacterium]|nr:ATP-binding protein [Lachnospiraceae bacterium]
MALDNSQYKAIIRGYEQTRDANRALLVSRTEKVYDTIPGFRELADSVSVRSVDSARRMLDGEENVMESLHRELARIASRQKEMLTQYGFPSDYLEPVYTCPDCQDTGYVTASDDSSGIFKKKCHCFRQQEIRILYAQSNIQDMISRENFSTLSYDYYQGDDLGRFEAAVSLCRKFIENFNNSCQNLFLYGTVGTGKSFLSGCIAKELLQEGHSVIYFSSSGLFETLARYSFDFKSKEALADFYEDFYSCDLLIIDDLGTEITNNFVTSQLFSCLNERYLRRKATLISTNISLAELRDRYSDRIFSRITSHFTLCKLTGPDIRILKKRLAKTSVTM